GKSIGQFVKDLFNESNLLKSEADAEKCLSKDKNITKGKDLFVEAADILVSRYNESVTAFQGSSPKRRALEAKIANQAFQVYGTSLPPDATFTLRISDGVVKGYEYNGTVAPVNTTYFGLYDRHYSNDKEFPWALPEKWENPPMDLLKSPLNFVSTNDIIGGNSGSAIINQNAEAVGLIFDGNIESLPGNFIFDEEHNRSVSVHTGGIVAAMRYIYGADRLVKELMNE
ncbi:MAG: S46 family peptidase, partial [Saprospiraceae bacterium]|nr:S46 family peptidase [Saprospiraceae bacterium]